MSLFSNQVVLAGLVMVASNSESWRPSPFYVQGDWEQSNLLALSTSAPFDLSASNGVPSPIGPMSTGDVGFVQLLEGSATVVLHDSCLGDKRLEVLETSVIALIPATAPTATEPSKKAKKVTNGEMAPECVISFAAGGGANALPSRMRYAIRVADSIDHDAQVSDIPVLEFRKDGDIYVRTSVTPGVLDPWLKFGTYGDKGTADFRIRMRLRIGEIEGALGYLQLIDLSVTPIASDCAALPTMTPTSLPYSYKGPWVAGVGVVIDAVTETTYFDEIEIKQSPSNIYPPMIDDPDGGPSDEFGGRLSDFGTGLGGKSNANKFGLQDASQDH